ncbi:MAG TPA: type II toxin-antitoxin system prevent-host-death family antitoxin [Steroidobacteraceae bacterium]|nr:type II toxin-antitoxin system prevent-host-death family antitoxin [Steroidobacteraceae bacterium]
MKKRISATDAKNNFGGLLEDVAALGHVEVVRHGRLVAVVLSPREWRALSGSSPSADPSAEENWRRNHMIPAPLARAARRVGPPVDFDNDGD